MSATKQKIRDAAQQLFNEKGYFPVTIRQVATKLGMSSGNLNYHYRKREDILEALYFEMVAHFDARVDALPQQDISLPQIRKDIYDRHAHHGGVSFLLDGSVSTSPNQQCHSAAFYFRIRTTEGWLSVFFLKFLQQKQLMKPSLLPRNMNTCWSA